MGSGAKVQTPQTEIAVCGDTIYWIEQVPNPCINNNTTYLLRRAYPTSAFPGPLSYQVQTIDTIRLRSGIFTVLPPVYEASEASAHLRNLE
jgi:hypothetical protein